MLLVSSSLDSLEKLQHRLESREEKKSQNLIFLLVMNSFSGVKADPG